MPEPDVRCPYLGTIAGTERKPETAGAETYCFSLPAEPHFPTTGHQNVFCFAKEHRQCPRFIAATNTGDLTSPILLRRLPPPPEPIAVTLPPTRPTIPPPTPVRRPIWRRLLLVAALVIIVLIAGGIAWALFGGQLPGVVPTLVKVPEAFPSPTVAEPSAIVTPAPPTPTAAPATPTPEPTATPSPTATRVPPLAIPTTPPEPTTTPLPPSPTPPPAPAPMPTDTYVVTGTDGRGLNVREGPGLEYPGFGALLEGTIVRVVEKARASDRSLWYRINVGRVDGWSYSRFLRPVDP